MCVGDAIAMNYTQQAQAAQAQHAARMADIRRRAAEEKDKGDVIDGEFQVVEEPMQIEHTKLLEHHPQEDT